MGSCIDLVEEVSKSARSFDRTRAHSCARGISYQGGSSGTLSERERAARLVSALALTTVLCACEAEPFVGRIHRSQYFEYHDRESIPLCDTLLPMLDEHALLLGKTFGSPPSSNNPFRYYKFRSYAELKANGDCSGGAGACEIGHAVLSPAVFDRHELVHAYAFAAWSGLTNGLLREGTAVALSCSPAARYTFAGSAPGWRELLNLSGQQAHGDESELAANQRTVRQYAAAGAFITHLAKRYGWARIGALYRRAPVGVSAADFEREFAHQFSASLDDEWSVAIGNGDTEACVRDPRCDLEPQVAGEQLGEPCIGAKRPFDLVTNRGARLSFVGSELTLRSCSDARQSYTFTGNEIAGAPATHVLQLPSARYVLDFERDFPASEVALEDYWTTDLVGDCGSSVPVPLTPTGLTYLNLPAGTTTGFVAVTGPSKRYAITPYPSILAGTIALCDGCDANAACTPLPLREATTLALPGRAVLQLERVISLDPARLRFSPLPD